MARYKVIVSSRADKFISELENFPFFTKPHDIAKLKGRKGYYRIRIGKLRTIFKVNKDQKTIYIEKIGHRKRIYE